MGAFCRVGLSGDYYLPSLQRAHRPRWTTLSASEPGAGDKLGARLRHSPRVCLVLHELALPVPRPGILDVDIDGDAVAGQFDVRRHWNRPPVAVVKVSGP